MHADNKVEIKTIKIENGYFVMKILDTNTNKVQKYNLSVAESVFNIPNK